jgi:N-acetylmuramoyl-L-alanine amidase
MNAFSCLLLSSFLAVPSSAAPARKKKVSPPPAPPAAPVPPLHPPRVSTEPVTFVWPAEGAVVASDADFAFGSVADPSAVLRINGTTVTVHRDGGFIAWLPIVPGTFTFHAELAMSTWTATADRHIFVPFPPAPLPDGELAIDTSTLIPRSNLEMRPGDWWTIRMKATRGKRAWARVAGGDWKEMRETNPTLGIYDLIQRVAPGEEFGPAPIEYRVGAGWSPARATGSALVSASGRTPAIAAVRAAAGYANLKTGPGDGFLLFPPNGTRFPVAGRDGSSVRVELAPGLTGWLDAKEVDVAAGVAPPRAETGNVGVTTGTAGASIRIALSERVPFEVVEDEDLDALTVRLFGAVGHTNLVIFDGENDLVDQVAWRQEADGVVAYRVKLKAGRRLWGYLARYDAGSSLRVDLRRPPRVDPKRPLAGVRVMLDPGHMPSAPGAIGPLGTKEMDANYAIAQAAAERLKQEGATVLLTRRSPDDEVSLVDRPRQAVERDADLFVSIHNNALPDGTNPFSKPRGFTVFYYHPHSLALGRAVHESYHRQVGVPDEGLQWDNLLVARLTYAPALLIENAYIILPEQEALLNEPSFRDTLAKSLVSGLRDFMAETGRGEEKRK